MIVTLPQMWNQLTHIIIARARYCGSPRFPLIVHFWAPSHVEEPYQTVLVEGAVLEPFSVKKRGPLLKWSLVLQGSGA